MTATKTKVGVGVIVVRNNRVLLGKRIGAHGEGTWAFPGGKPEEDELLVLCADRELTEETSMIAGVLKELPVITKDYFEETDIERTTRYVEAHFVKGEPVVLEPNKCLKWAWFEWDKLPEPLFAPLKSLLETGFVPNGIKLAA